MNLRLITSAAFTLALSGSLPLSAQKNPPSEGREVTKLYADACAGCHGADLTGGSAPGLVAGQWHFGGDDPSLTASISAGRSAAGMPAFRQTISRAEIRSLVIYLHERQAAWQRDRATFAKPEVDAVVHSEKASFKLEPVIATGLTEPWSVAFLPHGRMLVTERPGRLRIVQDGRLLPDPVPGVPNVYGGEGGLLDVALSPGYGSAGNDWIYLTYGAKSDDGQAMSAVLRAKLRDGKLVDQQPVFLPDAGLFRPGGQRFGSRLLFDGKGHLFFSIGDRAAPGDEQDLSRPNGKIHRVMEDGSVPSDNPFAHQPGALPTIWSYGHRNPQGLAFNPANGDLWEAEHGPRGGDELNIIHAGHNYGWPVITYGMNYDGTPITDHLEQPGLDQPVTYYVPSIATSALVFYTGDRIPEWRGQLFLGSLAGQEFRRLEWQGQTVTHQEILFKGIDRVRNVFNGPDGYLYLVLNQPDRILKLVPAQSSTVTTASLTH